MRCRHSLCKVCPPIIGWAYYLALLSCPAMIGGRGLKRRAWTDVVIRCCVAPAMIGGRGLKPVLPARILLASELVAPAMIGGRGLKRRAWTDVVIRCCVAPAMIGGRGLKPSRIRSIHIQSVPVAPAMIGGWGLLWVHVSVICCCTAPAPYGV